MGTQHPDGLGWRKSRLCDSAACVEVAVSGHRIGVRNSGEPGAVVWFSPEEWSTFVEGVRRGDFAVG